MQKKRTRKIVDCPPKKSAKRLQRGKKFPEYRAKRITKYKSKDKTSRVNLREKTFA